MDRQFIEDKEIIMIKPISPMMENEEEIPGDVKRFEEDDIVSAEIVFESGRIKRINENNDISEYIGNVLGLDNIKLIYGPKTQGVEGTNQVMCVWGRAGGEVWYYLWEGGEKPHGSALEINAIGSTNGNIESVDYMTMTQTLFNNYMSARSTMSVDDAMKSLESKVYGSFMQIPSDDVNESNSTPAKDLKSGDKVLYKGKKWIVAGHEGIDNSAILNAEKGEDSEKVTGKNKLIVVNEDLDSDLAMLEKLEAEGGFFQTIRKDWGEYEDSDLTATLTDSAAMLCENPSRMKKRLVEILDNYDVLDQYKPLLDEALAGIVNESSLEDRYYIQPGDRMTIEHKHFGKIEVKITKVDVKGNKVYWHSVKKGIFGCIGFDKIKGIRLIDEKPVANKKPINENALVQKDWKDLIDLIAIHKANGNIERTMNNSSMKGTSDDKLEFSIYCPDNDKLDAFLTEYNFLKYGTILDVVYVSTDQVTIKSKPNVAVNESVELQDILSIVTMSGSVGGGGVYSITAKQTFEGYSDIYLQLGTNELNTIPSLLVDVTAEEMSFIRESIENASSLKEAKGLLYDYIYM